ncbi:MAG TPA: peptidase S10 [Thermoanaerobaculia bacterium]|nr:peptidase S10 [Thermoanaerobaculia bacterium]
MKRVFAALLMVCATALFAAEEKKEPAPKESKDNISTTTHSIKIGADTINYTARAGTMVMKDEDGNPKASVFFVAYTRDGADAAKRPVTFSFNGGPGSSSVWLHMGCLGPKRVAYGDDEGHAAPPPSHLVDNEATILDVTDLVFIDPITTGYSRAIPVKEDTKYHGFEGDLDSVGEFIRLWTTRNNRWSSPKFLAGESYGTTRAAGLSGWLQDHGIFPNGIILISSILNFQTARFETGNDLPYELFLPTYTAIAWYHHKLPADLQSKSIADVTSEAEQFAIGPYASALMRGDALTDAEKNEITQKVARYTGLRPEYVAESNNRIRIDRFDKELLRDRRRTVGRYDGRFIGIDRDAAGERNESDPSYSAVHGAFTAVFNDYVRRELKFESDLPYEILTSRVRPWSYDKYENRYLDVSETLRDAMTENQYLHVYVANGYYDLATPFAATKYTFARA